MMNEVTKDEQARQKRNDAVEKCRRQTSHARTRTGRCKCQLVTFDAHLQSRAVSELEVTTKDAEWLAWWRGDNEKR